MEGKAFSRRAAGAQRFCDLLLEILDIVTENNDEAWPNYTFDPKSIISNGQIGVEYNSEVVNYTLSPKSIILDLQTKFLGVREVAKPPP